MEQASLVGLDSEGTSLILTVPGGKKLRLPIDEALKAAIRSDRSGFERARVEGEALRPRDIQSRVRAGASVEELAQDFGMDRELIMRYAAPVLDERGYFAEQAALLPSAHDFDAPPLGELTVERLREAGVPESDVTFDAYRDDDGWVLVARFGDGSASWRVDLTDKTAEPLDEIARRILTAEPVGPLLGRRLAAVQDEEAAEAPRALHPSAAGHPSMGAANQPADPSRLLNELDEARGVRVEMHLAEEFEDDAAPPTEVDRNADIVSLSHARTPEVADQPPLPPAPPEGPRVAGEPVFGAMPSVGSEVDRDLPTVPLPVDDDEDPDPDDDPTPPTPPPPVKPTSRSKRASVPSWDEIVFGAKPE